MPRKITHFDNRGGEESPFGFIYFGDDNPRVGYMIENHILSLFGSNWGDPSVQQFIDAERFLGQRFLIHAVKRK